MSPLLAWTVKIACALVLAGVTAATARAFAGRTHAAAFAGGVAGAMAALTLLALDPRPAAALACAGIAVFLHTARWREWLIWPPLAAALALEPALGLPLAALPLLRGASVARLVPLAVAALLAWILRAPLGFPSPALSIATLLLSAAIALGIGRAEPGWKPGSGLATALKVTGALAPALAILALLVSPRGILGAGPVVVGLALLAALAGGLVLFAASLGGVLLLGTRNDARPVALALGAGALVGIVLIGLPGALALLIPFLWSAGLGSHLLMRGRRRAPQGASVART